MSNLTYLFVHGLSGWGSYDKTYEKMPYWGMRGGDLIRHLGSLGYACYACSVSPTGSAWDRACELYAQVAGKRVDYGLVHSRTYGHERYGRDFSSSPLIPHWGEDTRLVLLGHSFGGPTALLFAELLANGNVAEKKEDPHPSELFLGGMGERIHSIVTIASPLNGTTAYDLFEDPSFNPDKGRIPAWSRVLAWLLSHGTRPRGDGRDERDTAAYDMHLDRARQLCECYHTFPWVYYYSLPCVCTTRGADGTSYPSLRKMEPLFVMRSIQIGRYTGKTKGGIEVDESWQPNDGLVNTRSSYAPYGAPSRPFEERDLHPGIWNILPTFPCDHMALQGGLMKKHDIRQTYEDLLRMISETRR